MNAPIEALAGMDAYEFAGGITYINPNEGSGYYETTVFRFGPAVYFGKHARLQLNAEYDQPADNTLDSTFLVRTQATFNFYIMIYTLQNKKRESMLLFLFWFALHAKQPGELRFL